MGDRTRAPKGVAAVAGLLLIFTPAVAQPEYECSPEGVISAVLDRAKELRIPFCNPETAYKVRSSGEREPRNEQWVVVLECANGVIARFEFQGRITHDSAIGPTCSTSSIRLIR